MHGYRQAEETVVLLRYGILFALGNSIGSSPVHFTTTISLRTLRTSVKESLQMLQSCSKEFSCNQMRESRGFQCIVVVR